MTIPNEYEIWLSLMNINIEIQISRLETISRHFSVLGGLGKKN